MLMLCAQLSLQTGMASTALLPSITSHQVACKLLLTGDLVTAQVCVGWKGRGMGSSQPADCVGSKPVLPCIRPHDATTWPASAHTTTVGASIDDESKQHAVPCAEPCYAVL